jgi:DNA-binding GntR family transcriptional regulator
MPSRCDGLGSVACCGGSGSASDRRLDRGLCARCGDIEVVHGLSWTSAAEAIRDADAHPPCHHRSTPQAIVEFLVDHETADGRWVTVARQRSLGIKSTEDAVYEAIRQEILDGIPPGTPLRLAPIAERLGVSTMPVRTALTRLEAEGLVRQVRNRGAVIAPLSVDDFEEIQALRAGIEGLAARRGAPLMTDRDMQAALGALVKLRTAADDNRLGDYLRINQEIHDICYRAGGRGRLMELIEDHRRPAERYVRQVIAASPHFLRSVEYTARFVDACASRDGERAELALREALQASVRQIALMLPGSEGEPSGMAQSKHREKRAASPRARTRAESLPS